MGMKNHARKAYTELKNKGVYFTLKKYDGNAYKFDGRVLLTTHLFKSGNLDHLDNDDEWGEVSIYAFNTDKEYEELYELAENPSKRIYITREIA